MNDWRWVGHSRSIIRNATPFGLIEIIAAGIAFHKKRGLAVVDMTQRSWVYRKLRNFGAGIEAGISCFKRAYGGGRCTWRGLDHFKAYVWSAVVAHNLVLFARLKPT
jgi:IS5 family transposase